MQLARLAFIFLALSSLTAAQAIRGAVTNGTTGKPAAGVDIILLNLGQGGMEEAARTKTDAQGRFAFAAPPAAQQLHLLRAVYQDVTYHKQLPPGATTADMEVFDATKKLA